MILKALLIASLVLIVASVPHGRIQRQNFSPMLKVIFPDEESKELSDLIYQITISTNIDAAAEALTDFFLYILKDRATVERAKMLEAVKTNVVTNPRAFTPEVELMFQKDLADAVPQNVLEEFTGFLRSASDADTRKEHLSTLYDILTYAKPNKVKVTKEEFISAVEAGNLDSITNNY